MCVCCLCVLTSLDLRDRRSSVSMSVTSALKSSAVFMASTWWPRNRQIQTLDFGWIANGYWNELHSSTPGLLVRFSAIIQHPEAFIQFQHSYLQMQNTWCLETINILLSADQTKSAENQASLYLVSIRCVPPEKLEPGLQHFKILHYLQQGLESLTNESRCDYQMQYMKENHLKKKIGWPDPPPCHWCHHISGWKSTLSSQPGVITWQFVACFEQKLSLPWLFWQNLGRSSACPQCTHPPRIPGFCITTTSVQVRTSLQKHVSLKLQPQIWKKISKHFALLFFPHLESSMIRWTICLRSPQNSVPSERHSVPSKRNLLFLFDSKPPYSGKKLQMNLRQISYIPNLQFPDGNWAVLKTPLAWSWWHGFSLCSKPQDQTKNNKSLWGMFPCIVISADFFAH